MNYSLEERLKNFNLTKAQRRIAEFCLQNKNGLPLLSSAEIARQVGVSDVSVIRFAKLLGYESFVDFKHQTQKEVAGGPYYHSPITSFVSGHDDEQNCEETPLDLRATYVQVVQDVFDRNDQKVFDEAAKIILASRNKYILGIRFRSSVAKICANLLRLTTTNVIQFEDADYMAFQQSMDMMRDDCLIWFSFGRFSNFEKQMLDTIKRSGVQLIVVSNERASRIALEADLFIQSFGHTTMPFYSSVGNCLIAERIANAVIEIGWQGAEKRLKSYETLLSTIEIPEE